jgi:hypothetical protein
MSSYNLVFLEPRSTYDNMILGISTEDRVVYDQDAIIQYLAQDFLTYAKEENQELTEDEAYQDATEFFEFNIAGAYVGEHTPIYCFKSVISF